MAGNSVLIVGEIAGGQLSPITGELVAAAAPMAQALGGEVVAALGGAQVGGLAAEAAALGAHKVYATEHPLLEEYFHVDAHLAVLEAVAKAVDPSVILMGKTILGRDAGPRLAFRLGAGLAQECVKLSLDPESGVLTGDRPVYGGASLARVTVSTSPKVATVRPKAFDPVEPDASHQGEVVDFPVELDPKLGAVKLVEQVRAQAAGVRLEDARIVVAGGRGLGGPEPFEQLEELARLLGGAMGASRAACDAGWLSHSHQIGLTGKSIAAELYITFAISGASQHVAGMSSVKNTVAVNKDESANIFKEARYGIVGDWEKVLPAFTNKVRELVDG